MKKMYKKIGSEFSMRRTVELIATGETHVFIRIIYPECFGLKNKETTLNKELFEKEYKEA